MSESLLKKEFSSSDLQRIRNIVKKDYTAKTVKGVGYGKKTETYKEGDIWVEDGKQWTIKDGLRQSINKLDSLREVAKMPICCPKCGSSMSANIHKKMYKIHKFCFNCVLEFERELKDKGLYKEYEKAIIEGNIRAFAEDLERVVQDLLSEQDNGTFVTEQGDIESWKSSGKLKNNKLEELNKFLKHINTSL